MISTRNEWNDSLKLLQSVIRKPVNNIQQIRDLACELHGFCHESLSAGEIMTWEDRFWQDAGRMTRFTGKNPYSVAWHLWHSARIEDITCSHFIVNQPEILDAGDFLRSLNIPFRHTGNSMTPAEMEVFNARIDIGELRRYRSETAAVTRRVLESLDCETLGQRVGSSSLSAIRDAGSVAEPDAWLLDYWGGKTISGIILMPFTRHLMVHLNSAMRVR